MNDLRRTLTLSSTLAIVVGGVIGSGIFMKPSLMMLQLGSPMVLLAVWIAAGAITLCGALSNAEVASMFPETGGQYVFFQKMYGDGFAFFYGWASFTVFNTAGNASIAYVFSQYINYFIELPRLPDEQAHAVLLHIPFIGKIYPLENIGLKILTALLIILLTMLNYMSVNYSSGLQRFLTSLKAVAIVLLIGGLLFSGKGSLQNVTANAPDMPTGWALVRACMAAMAGAFWAYDGWNNISYVAGEINNPQRNIPRSLLLGLSFCIIVYALVNLAFTYVLPVETMSHSSYVAADAATAAWGVAGGTLVTLLVIFSTLGATNANVLATSRITFAMGKEIRLLSVAGKVHQKNMTPGNALIMNAIWAVVLIFSGSFDMLTDMLIFITWFFYGMSTLGVFILRIKMKKAERPYKVPGYPFVPLLFVAFTVFFLISTVYTDVLNYQNGVTPIINSLFGFVIVITGLPVYLLSSKK